MRSEFVEYTHVGRWVNAHDLERSQEQDSSSRVVRTKFCNITFEENQMRKVVIKVIALSVLAGTPFFVSAQTADDPAGRSERTADRDDHGEWGWLGLLGLAGLMGLKRRDRDHIATRDRATAR
jgi:hypothetical protein